MRIADYKPIVTDIVATAVRSDGTPTLLPANIPAWDYRAFTRAGGNITQIVYKKGGAAGTIVVTQNFTYTGSDIDTETLVYP
jgi:hypothetical protein